MRLVGHLLKLNWTYMFHKTRGISGLADDLLASHGGLRSRELVGESVTISRNLELSVADEIHTVKVGALRSEVQSLTLWRQSVKLAIDRGYIRCSGGGGGGRYDRVCYVNFVTQEKYYCWWWWWCCCGDGNPIKVGKLCKGCRLLYVEQIKFKLGNTKSYYKSLTKSLKSGHKDAESYEICNCSNWRTKTSEVPPNSPFLARSKRSFKLFLSVHPSVRKPKITSRNYPWWLRIFQRLESDYSIRHSTLRPPRVSVSLSSEELASFYQSKHIWNKIWKRATNAARIAPPHPQIIILMSALQWQTSSCIQYLKRSL